MIYNNQQNFNKIKIRKNQTIVYFNAFVRLKT